MCPYLRGVLRGPSLMNLGAAVVPWAARGFDDEQPTSTVSTMTETGRRWRIEVQTMSRRLRSDKRRTSCMHADGIGLDGQRHRPWSQIGAGHSSRRAARHEWMSVRSTA
jgi:hypothetical protein